MKRKSSFVFVILSVLLLLTVPVNAQPLSPNPDHAVSSGNNDDMKRGKKAPKGPVSMLSAVGAATVSPSTDYLEVAVAQSGNYTCGIPSGPILLYGHPGPWSSGTTIRVDGSDHWNYNTNSFGTEVTAPHNTSGTTNQGEWRVQDIGVVQNLEIVDGSSGNADTMKISYVLTNHSVLPHHVGVRVMLDTMLGRNDGAPFRAPSIGEITTEQEYSGADVPIYWEAFESLTDSNSAKARGTLLDNGQLPDRVVFAYWGHINDTPWDFTVNPSQEVTRDSAIGIYWNPVELQPGESITRTTYYGLSELTVNGSIALSAPAELTMVAGHYSPNPFPVTLYISNTGATALSNVTATLTLPDGLVLASGNLSKTIGTVDARDTTQATWDVYATGAVTGTLSFSARVTGTHLVTQNASRDILVPAPSTASSQVSLHATHNPSRVGQNVTFTATVAPQAPPSTPIPTGTVAFTLDGNSVGMISLTNGQAGYSTDSLTLGNHTLVASYSGDNNYSASSDSLVQVVTQGNAMSDIVVTGVLSPSMGVQGEMLEGAQATVMNQGTAAVGPFHIRFYLSKDRNVTRSDVDTGWGCDVAGLEAGNTFICYGPVGVPTSAAPRDYYLGVYADLRNRVRETNEENNRLTASNRITVTTGVMFDADLTITGVTGPAMADAGSIVNVVAMVKNRNFPSRTGPFQVRFYLSNDRMITTSDIDTRVGCDISNLPGSRTSVCHGSLHIPSSVAPGNYYLGAYADPSNCVRETNEGNNGLAAMSTMMIHMEHRSP
ncbi:exported hypothetical protein [Gammaproteobacteria bacterium]